MTSYLLAEAGRHVVTQTDGPGDRLLTILKVIGVIVAIILFMVLCVFAAAIAMYAGPPLLLVALIAWIAGADWWGTCAVGGACCTLVGMFALANNS